MVRIGFTGIVQILTLCSLDRDIMYPKNVTKEGIQNPFSSNNNIAHGFWVFDEHFGFAELILICIHLHEVHEVFDASPDVTTPLRVSLGSQDVVSEMC